MKLLIIIFTSLFCYSCLNTKDDRPFFNEMQAHYHNDFLDSAGIIKKFGLEKESVTINNQRYWRLKGDKHTLFNFVGFIRFSDSKLYFLPEDYYSCIKYIALTDFIVFDFNNLDSIHKIYYLCSSNYSSGDEVKYIGKKYYENVRDTVYSFKFTRFQYFNSSKSSYLEEKEKIIEIAKNKGFIKCILPKGRDSLSWSFFPEFKLLDSGLFFQRKSYSL